MDPPPLPGPVVGIADQREDPIEGGAPSLPTDDGASSSLRYIAVRRGGGDGGGSGIQLENAIFLRWCDAEAHVTGPNGGDAEYQEFGTMEEAAAYLVANSGAAAPAAAGDKRKRTSTNAGGDQDDQDYEEDDDDDNEVLKTLSSKRSTKPKRSKKKKKAASVAGRMAREPTEKWNLQYDRLVHYHATHGGSTKIAASDKANDDLRKWLVNQRSQLNQSLTKAEEQGESLSPHLQSKIDRFEALGVDIRNSNRRVQHAARWNEMYAQLCAYKEAHGDCLVPTENSEYSKLATWIYQQQKEYRKFKEGKGNSSKLTADHVVRLNDIGFAFERREKFLSWEERLEQLRQFKAQHGHLKVPTQHPELGQFTSKMRRECREFTDGKPDMKISADTMRKRIADLTELGFVFQAGKRLNLPPKRLQKNWDQRFEELVQYKEVHGHCVVPQSTPGLGEWVHRQRKDYKALRADKPTRMTAARAIKLQEVGFVFDTREMGKKPTGAAAAGAKAAGPAVDVAGQFAADQMHVGYHAPVPALHGMPPHHAAAAAAAVAAGTHAAVYGDANAYV